MAIVPAHTHKASDITSGRISDIYIEPTILQLQGKGTNISLSNGKMINVPLNPNSALQIGKSVYLFPYAGGIQVDTYGIYLISASAYIEGRQGQTGAGVYVFCTDNAKYWGNGTKEIMGTLAARNGAISGSVSCASKLVQLDAGDVIYLAARSVGSNSVCRADNMMTFLRIERLKHLNYNL